MFVVCLGLTWPLWRTLMRLSSLSPINNLIQVFKSYYQKININCLIKNRVLSMSTIIINGLYINGIYNICFIKLLTSMLKRAVEAI